MYTNEKPTYDGITYNFQIESSAATQTAFVQAIASSYYIPDIPGISTSPTPTPTPTPGTSTTTDLSDRTWSFVSNGVGPVEKDRSNGDWPAGDGRTLTLNGTTYTKGLGVHAPAEIRYALGGACSRLTASVGVDDEVGANGSVVFQVWADGVQLYDSGAMTGATATRTLDVTLSGRTMLAAGGDQRRRQHQLRPRRLGHPPHHVWRWRDTDRGDDGPERPTWSFVSNGVGPVEKDRSNGDRLCRRRPHPDAQRHDLHQGTGRPRSR
ncbi:MAG: NPCBM/NEW2 domain-containing protein [Dehalococcoidia bacterium]